VGAGFALGAAMVDPDPTCQAQVWIVFGGRCGWLLPQ